MAIPSQTFLACLPHQSTDAVPNSVLLNLDRFAAIASTAFATLHWSLPSHFENALFMFSLDGLAHVIGFVYCYEGFPKLLIKKL